MVGTRGGMKLIVIFPYTSVINVKDAPEDWQTNSEYVYIGRTGKGLVGPWGNPFLLLPPPQARLDTLSTYKHWLLSRDKEYLNKMKQELRGKTLVCFCKPKPCHGDIIIEFVEGKYGA